MSVRRNAALTITFEAIDLFTRPARKSGLSIAATDIWISKDGEAFANATNAAVEIGTTGRYKLVLTAVEMDAAWVHVYVEKTNLMDPCDVKMGTHGGPSGAVVANVGNTALAFKTNRTESGDNFWKNLLCLFTTGALAGQEQKITGYDGTTKFISVASPFTASPADTDRFVLVNI